MKMTLQFKAAWIIFLLTLVTGFVAYSNADSASQIATHWDSAGNPDGYSEPLVAFFMMPFIQTIMLAIFSSLKILEPRAANLEKSKKAIGAVVNAVTALLLVVQAIIIDQAFEFGLLGTNVIFAGVGVILMVMGNYFGKLKSSFFIGIRTPWTLSSETVWQKTHRVGGKLFFAAGAIIAIAPFVLTQDMMGPVLVSVILPAALVPIFYSWYLWRKEQQSATH